MVPQETFNITYLSFLNKISNMLNGIILIFLENCVPIPSKNLIQNFHDLRETRKYVNAAQHTRSSLIEHSPKDHLAEQFRQRMLNVEMQTEVLCPQHLAAILHS